MIDIHCHLLPGLDDGPATWDETLAMAKLAVAAGTDVIVATPHQLGGYASNRSDQIRRLVGECRARLEQGGIPLHVVPGADVRIEADLLERLRNDDVLTLADGRRYLLLELPHELYFPLEGILDRLRRMGVIGILSHPERNRGILSDPSCLATLVRHGCLMQVTASSFLGGFGDASQRLAESMLAAGQVHFVASDGHGTKYRRPRLLDAYQRVAFLAGGATARRLFVEYPEHVLSGEVIAPVTEAVGRRQRRWSPKRWLPAMSTRTFR